MDKKIMVTRSSMPKFDEYAKEISSIWQTVWLTNMGEKHNLFQNELEKLLEVQYMSLFSNGHLALELAIQAMNLSGEVITTPYSFASTTHAIVRNGLKPIFCDINEDDYTINVNKIEDLITDKTTAILPVHVYGNICDVEKIDNIAKKHNLKVIYDAAHAFNVKVNGSNVATYGDASMFSFHATKVFHTIEGGAIATSSEELYKKLYKLKNFGIENAEVVDEIGSNAKMNEFQAAMGLCNLRHLETEIKKRKEKVLLYREYLQNISGLHISEEIQGVESNYSYFPVVFDKDILGVDRNQIFDSLQKENIMCRKYFYPLISDYDCYKSEFNSLDTPIAKKIASSVLTLPLYADIECTVIEKICNIINSEIKRV